MILDCVGFWLIAILAYKPYITVGNDVIGKPAQCQYLCEHLENVYALSDSELVEV